MYKDALNRISNRGVLKKWMLEREVRSDNEKIGDENLKGFFHSDSLSGIECEHARQKIVCCLFTQQIQRQ